jgi:transcriptional regulator with XRE-family HTH domain
MIGKMIQKLRLEKRFSKEALARESGLNRMTIWKIETGLTDPGVKTLQALADALGVEIQLFFGSSDSKS